MKVLVIVPCRDINDVVQTERQADAMAWLYQNRDVYELVFAREKGYGYAIKKVMQSNPDYDAYVVAADDFAMPAWMIPRLVEKVQEGYDLVVGSRRMKGAFMLRASHTRLRGFASDAYNVLFGKIFATGLTEHWCDFRAFSPRFVRRVLPYTHENHFMWIPESIVVAQRLGYNVTEVPIQWDKRWSPSPMSFKRLSVDVKELMGIWRLRRRMGEYRVQRIMRKWMIEARRG